jgi:hypothetical protein
MMSTDNSPFVREEQQNFVYEFKVEDAIPYSKALPKEFKISAECNIVGVIYESFVVTADQDYLTARLLAKSGLYRAFYWAAAQAIEKYLKAFLLLRGESVRDETHYVEALYTKACTLDASLRSITIEPHNLLSVPEYARDHLKVFSTIEFLQNIDKFGRPDNRYNSFCVDFNTGCLFALDHFVFSLREKTIVPDIWQSLRKVDGYLIDTLEMHNPWFSREPIASDSPQTPVVVEDSMAVTKLDFLVKQSQNPPYRLALKWLNQMMKLPNELRKRIENL